MKPWDGFCGPLEVRTHPLPPPDSGASFSSFGVFLFEIWVLRFRSRVLRFRDLGVFVFDLECFVFEFWVLRFRDLGVSFSRFGCFVLRSSFSSASFSKLQGSEDETMFYVTLTFFSGQYKTWTADCGLRTVHKKYGLGKKRGLENTHWVQNTD